jgi:hypothetical protein
MEKCGNVCFPSDLLKISLHFTVEWASFVKVY